MKLPQLVDYRDAMATPNLSLVDPDLRRGVVKCNPHGLPWPISGGFALTFEVRVGSDRYAVRCFHKDRRHLRERYTEIAGFVDRSGLPSLVKVDYLPDGIRVGSGLFPVVRMCWVEGARLDHWIEDNLSRPADIKRVRQSLTDAVRALRRHDVAHGDLQHGNILVQAGGSIRLVDYDGMYLPPLRDFGSAEQGNRNYQHPDRDHQYDSSLDVFAAAVIDLSLAAVIHDSTLWDQFNQGSGERLLFSADDFADPDSSELFDRLVGVPELAEQAKRLRAACMVSAVDVPAIINGWIAQSIAAGARSKSPGSAPTNVLTATHRTTLLARQGDYVTVIGRVVAVKRMQNGRGGLITFINFGKYWYADFAVVAWDKAGRDLERLYGDPEDLRDQWIAVTGLLSVYQHWNWGDTPQIELDSGRAISVLTATEAQRQLSAATAVSTSTAAQPPWRRPRAGSNQTSTTSATNWDRTTTPSSQSATGGSKDIDDQFGDIDDQLSRLYSSSLFTPEPDLDEPPF
jgi:serine/threonine protein kinase